MKRKIFLSVFLPVLTAILLVVSAVLFYEYGAVEKRLFRELDSECAYLSAGIAEARDEAAFLKNLRTQNRVTLIDEDGTVLFDSSEDASKLKNHGEREEVLAALATGAGQTSRYSDTQLMKNLYSALRLPDGRVIRVATAKKSVFGLIDASFTAIFFLIVAAVALAAAGSRLLAKRIVKPINGLDLDHPLDNAAYDELAPLLTRMEKQRRENEVNTQRLMERERAFAAVSENMREGLLLLDRSGRILTINGSAAMIFGAAKAVKGSNVLTLNRSAALSEALDTARREGVGDTLFLKDGRSYQIHASAVTEAGLFMGTVVLLLDVTDREAAEETRREFTANVSHELKTPLTAISGYAEILRDGLVKSEDVARFAGKIYDEAERMIALVMDILNLSRLDEKATLEQLERTDLLPLCQSVLKRLEPLAKENDVSLLLDGGTAEVMGAGKILDEIIYNLVENAIKYNRPGGSVTVYTALDPKGRAMLTVSDTGVGIPKEHQGRVFERFYRVDKSHSRAIGGTGLGLSIVKHGAEFHRAELHLDSDLGRGTRVTLTFPKA